MRYKPVPIETDVLCKYGCSQLGTHVLKDGTVICGSSPTKCSSNRKKNSNGLKDSGRNWGEVYKNLPQESKDRMVWNKGIYSANFSYGGRGNHKAVLIQERSHRCESCMNIEWLGQPITIELEHVDGDNLNNERENLKLLCPNCHSQTDTWKGKNINKRDPVPDDVLIKYIKEGHNNRQVLIRSGLTGKGRNYERVNNLRARVAQLEGGN